jgi:hypothetical protein
VSTSQSNGGCYVYIHSEPGLWTAGFYRPGGVWEPESDHESEAKAAARVHWLNGGSNEKLRPALEDAVEWIQDFADGRQKPRKNGNDVLAAAREALS